MLISLGGGVFNFLLSSCAPCKLSSVSVVLINWQAIFQASRLASMSSSVLLAFLDSVGWLSC